MKTFLIPVTFLLVCNFFFLFFLIKNQITVKYNKSTTTDDKGVILVIYFVHYYKMVKNSGHSISFSLLVSKTNTG